MKIGGTVKFWNVDNGWGFVRPDDGGDDIFLHAANLPEDIEPKVRQP